MVNCDLIKAPNLKNTTKDDAMHVVKLSHKQLEKTASIHKKRLASLFDVVETAIQTQYVTLTGLGRRLAFSAKIKR